jgi:hypothetical protein
MQSLQEAAEAGYTSITQLSETFGLSAGTSSYDTEPVADVESPSDTVGSSNSGRAVNF